MKFDSCIKAFCDGPETAAFSAELITERSGEPFAEYHALVTNLSDRVQVLGKVTLFETDDLAACGIGAGPYDVFRSGRHKNDMPGIFTIGCRDERLSDVASVMSESGEGQEAGDSCLVVSDHLTIIKGATGKCLVIEFLTGRDQLFETVIDLDEQGNFVKLTAGVSFSIEIQPGESVQTESIRVALVDAAKIGEEIEEFAERKAVLYGRRNARKPAVFCTWYYYGLSVTYEDVKTNLAIIKERKLPYDIFQVDEGWEVTLGEYVPNAKFPLPMKQVADEIRAAGYIPGIWSSPFVAHETASIWKKHPEWILKDKAGKPCLFPMNDTVYYVFDITNPGTYDYFRELYRMFTFDWGYTYHKLDFTRAAVIYEDAAFFDRRVTLAQAYYRAVKAIREGMGEEAFFLMCGGLYDPIIGLVDAQRTGSDVLSMWSSTVNKGGKTAPYTIRQSFLRYYMNRWWANDPDALMIRKNETMERNSRLTLGLLNDEEVKTSVVNQFAGGGIMCQTEPLDKIPDERLMEIRHILPVMDTLVSPLDFLSGERFPGAMDVYVKKTGVHCVCLVNWSDTEEMKIALRPADVIGSGSAAEDIYAVCEFYSGEYRIGVRAEETVKFPPVKPHAAAVIKIEKMEGQPVIVKSDGHYSMGAECSVLAMSGGKLEIKKKNILPVRTHCSVFLPGRESLLELTL
ncbi:MAG: alpha-galactosidase [Lachnospiraceae bacterium]|nr:alpha-galactosidase [Lachnospiraceae bacterium]